MAARTAVPDVWIPDLSQAGGAKYLAIADGIADAIAAGRLRAGDRLLPQRDLAARLGVDLTTVTKAYDQARARGLIGARGRAGSFVLAQPAIAAGPPPIDTGMNMPPEVEGGSLIAAWERTTSALLRAPGAGARLHYMSAGGLADDRAAGVAIFARLGLASSTETVIVTPGAQSALAAIVAAKLNPGDVVACGAHCYPGFLAIARRAELRIAALDVMDAGALEILCRRERVAALYLVPTNDNPTTATLDMTERAALATVAMRHDVMLIEDDAYGQLVEAPLPPISSLAPELGWYISSVSKTISPAIRIAHVRAPDVRGALAVAEAGHRAWVMAPPLNAALVTRWLEDGSYDRLIAETRAEARARQVMAAKILPPGRYRTHPDGYHLWVPLPTGVDPSVVAGALRSAGMTAITSDIFAARPNSAPALRLSLGGALTRGELTRGLTMLDMTLTSDGGGAGVV